MALLPWDRPDSPLGQAFHRAAHEFCSSGVTWLADAFALDDFPEVEQQYLDIQAQRPVVYVPNIQEELILQVRALRPLT